MTSHQAIRSAMRRRHLTQRRVAAMVGISEAYLSQILSGKRTPSTVERRIFRACGITDIRRIK